MKKRDLEFLKQLLLTPSPSGFERNAAHIWRDYVSEFADKVSGDYHGNTIAGINVEKEDRIMLSGHIDELGFIVSYINEKGFIYFRPIGGHDKSIVAGRGVYILNKRKNVYGVTGKKAIHMMTAEERKKVPEFEQMWIDIGVNSKEEALEKISIGDPVIYDVEYKELNGKIIVSRAFDDKAGAFAVALALKLLNRKKLKTAVYSVATVQEEVGIRGAQTSAFGLDPQLGIAVDVTHATDHPDVDMKKEGEVLLGKGPVILRGANSNEKIVDMLVDCARQNKIPFQYEAHGGGTGTDANAIQLTRSGVATGLVSIPLRYMHTPREIVHLDDIENTAKLLAAFVEKVSNVNHFVLD